VVWTGFYGDKNISGPAYYSVGGETVPPTSIGARILGQKLDDHFGTSVGSDGTWLYISAPDRTAMAEDVPALDEAAVPGDRLQAGVVYQLRTNVHLPGQPNLAQLWIEPGVHRIPDPENPNDPNSWPYQRIRWPYVDAEIADGNGTARTDYTMPVPHQYIIETVGSTRGNYDRETVEHEPDTCPGDLLGRIVAAFDKAWAIVNGNAITFENISRAGEVSNYTPYPTDTAGYHVDRTPQIVGPHEDAHISFVRGLGDVNDDGVADFAVGSELIEDPNPANPVVVGAIYIVFSRPPGNEGDYLLENLALAPTAPKRLRGLMLKGAGGEALARTFDHAGDFNGDGIADVVVGNDAAVGNTGEAIVVLGAATLTSPQYGWTVDGIVAAGKAIRFSGANPGDLTGANVTGVGDMDGDGIDDILISAPGAANANGDANAGAVYLVYGSPLLAGEYDLADIGTVDLPGVKFYGRAAGDQLGGGTKLISDTDPAGSDTTARSRGVAKLGDIDGDGHDDIAISAMLADPQERQDAGEVYVIYGRGD
jgi:hypothetical protein